MITRILGLSHLPINNTFGTQTRGWGLALTDLGITNIDNTTSTAKPNGLCIDTDGSLAVKIFSTPKLGYAFQAISPAYLFLGTGNAAPLEIVVSFYMEHFTAAQGGADSELTVAWSRFGFHDGLTASAAKVLYPFVTAIDPSGFYEIVLNAASVSEAYTATVYRDGKLLRTVPMTTTFTPAKLTKFGIGFGHYTSNWLSTNNTATNAIHFKIRNLYVTANLGIDGDTQIGRLGPCTVSKLPVLSTNQPAWTPSTDDIKTVLNTKRVGPTPSMPNLTVDAALSPLRIKCDPTGLPSIGRPIAIQSAISTYAPSGEASFMKLSWSYGGVSSAEVVVTASTDNVTLKEALGPILPKLPSGARLTRDVLAGLELVVKPSEAAA